jgi:hypothetical protein
MADAPPKDPPPPAPPPLPSIEHWSAISQGDLGLKAVYWTDDKKVAIISRPIVGWVSYTVRRVTDILQERGFAAVVITDRWFPTIASFLPRYFCIAPKDAPDDEIIETASKWVGNQNPPPVPPSGPGPN